MLDLVAAVSADVGQQTCKFRHGQATAGSQCRSCSRGKPGRSRQPKPVLMLKHSTAQVTVQGPTVEFTTAVVHALNSTTPPVTATPAADTSTKSNTRSVSTHTQMIHTWAWLVICIQSVRAHWDTDPDSLTLPYAYNPSLLLPCPAHLQEPPPECITKELEKRQEEEPPREMVTLYAATDGRMHQGLN